MITQCELKKYLSYDPDTGDFVRVFARSSVFKGTLSGWVGKSNSKRYVYIDLNGKKYRAHRLAFLYMTGTFPVGHVDHIDGDGTNNRWCNLRDVDPNENKKNVKLQANNSSGQAGVSWCSSHNKWMARINVNKKPKHLGYFVDKCAAIEVRKLAEKQFGYHANHGQQRPLYG